MASAKPTPTMTASEIKEALRRRHPAAQRNGPVTVPGPWTVVEEYRGIDLLAFSAHASPGRGAQPGARYPRVGYEVKVSRADLRQELLHPGKRYLALSFCHEFYLAVPKGLLSAEEIAWEEPEHFADYATFQRALCPGPCRLLRRGKSQRSYYFNPETGAEEVCPTCGGRGYLDKSQAELEAPTCWVPREIGLIEVDGRGARVRKPSPLRQGTGFVELSDGELADLVRWVSARHDPRHDGLVQRAREHSQELRELARKRRQRR